MRPHWCWVAGESRLGWGGSAAGVDEGPRSDEPVGAAAAGRVPAARLRSHCRATAAQQGLSLAEEEIVNEEVLVNHD